MAIYQIAGWDDHFENNKSRTIDECSYVAMPNKQHGMGFIRLMAQPDGVAMMGMWALILQAASRQKRPRQGWLTEDGTVTGPPWEVDDLALRWRCAPELVQRSLDFLSSEKVGWIRRYADSAACQQSGAAQVPPKCPSGAGEVPSNHSRREQLEQREGREGAGTAPAWLPTALASLGLDSSAVAATEWDAFLFGKRIKAADQDEAVRALGWLVSHGASQGVEIRYCKHAAPFAAAWRQKSAPPVPTPAPKVVESPRETVSEANARRLRGELNPLELACADRFHVGPLGEWLKGPKSEAQAAAEAAGLSASSAHPPVSGLRPDEIRDAVQRGDALAVVRAYGGNLDRGRRAEWGTATAGMLADEVVVVLHCAMRRQQAIREPSGFRDALATWRAEDIAVRKEIAAEVMGELGIEVGS